MKSQVTKELLFTYFEGRATAFQKRLIDQWVKQEKNAEFFYECLTEWEWQNPQYAVDVSSAIECHQQRMVKGNNQIDAPIPRDGVYDDELRIRAGFNKRRGWLIAASVSLILLAGMYLSKDLLLFQTYQTNFGETKHFTLTDGSEVSLNANSTLQVPRFGFGSQTRKVFLSGEADFSITHTTDNQKFIIQTREKLEVIVLGTEFTVYARPRGTKVVLSKGKVQLKYQEEKAAKQLIMKPGDLVTLDPNGRASLRKTAEPQNYSAWKEHRFVFEETSLAEITHIFDDNFGIEVKIADKDLADWSVSGSFTAHNAEELLDILTQASNLSYRKDRNSIVIGHRK